MFDNFSRVYPMCSRPRGQAVIINNQKFDDEVTYPFRQGADVDADNLDNLFTQLDFKVGHHQFGEVKTYK